MSKSWCEGLKTNQMAEISGIRRSHAAHVQILTLVWFGLLLEEVVLSWIYEK